MTASNYSLQQLAEHINAQIVGDPTCIITGLATLKHAGKNDLSFLSNSAYRKYLSTTQASAVIVSEEESAQCNAHLLVVKDPYVAYAHISQLYAKTNHSPQSIHTTAIIGSGCQIHSSVSIGAHCVVGDNVILGKNCVVGAGCIIGNNLSIGANTRLFPRVTLYDGVSIGDKVNLHSGVIIGSDGFGFANEHGAWVKVSQLGTVRIGNHVDIGANTVIDRGALGDTIIEDGVIIDNLVQIAHNVHIGAHTAIAGCVGIAGSTHIGKYCIIGGAANISGHLTIADGVHLSGMAMITRSILKRGVYSSGTGFDSNHNWRKNAIRFKQLDAMARQINQLDKTVRHLTTIEDE